jgi:hypothetical protein
MRTPLIRSFWKLLNSSKVQYLKVYFDSHLDVVQRSAIYVAVHSTGSTMASIPFSTLPYPVASSANLAPFTICTPDADIEKLKVLLKYSPIAPPNWANSHKDGSFGISREVLAELAEYWQSGYDW